MSDAIKIWERKDKQSKFSKIASNVKKPEPLRERISFTIYKLKAQKGRLDQAYQRMQSHYNEIFRKCTNAVLAKDSARASIYANECAEVKKMCQTILRNQFAIEQVVLRLETVEEFGDVMAEMSPLAGVINSIKGNLSGIIPEVSSNLGEIGDTLNDLVMDSGGVVDRSWNAVSPNEGAEKILADANTIAEQKIKEKFPTLPDTRLQSLEGEQ
ncbi:MAG: Snf7 family protein [Candidatus Bathyarchaeota archaeon]